MTLQLAAGSRPALRLSTILLTVALLLSALAGCGGGGSSDPLATTSDGFGPGSPSSCPHAQQSDIWFNSRLGCLAAGQRFINNAASATGDKADRAYILSQQVLDGKLNNILGANVLRYFKYAVCVRNAPSGLAPLNLAGDLATAMGLNLLISAQSYYPPGLASSTFQYGGIADVNTLQVACDASKHPVIVSFDTGRIESVNPAALAAVTVLDR